MPIMDDVKKTPVLKHELGTPTSGRTPGRRLGLSRKRPSSFSTSSSPKLGTSPFLNTPVLQERTETPSKQPRTLGATEESCIVPFRRDFLLNSPSRPVPSSEPTDKEDYLKQLEKKLSDVSDHSVLEKDIVMWRGVCKEALLELQSQLASTMDSKMTCRELSQKLGIWCIVKQQFDGDSEVIGSDDETELNSGM